ncbi:MAG: nucleotide sugar dehydrogenase [Actinomycetota bacterium]
MNLLTLIQEKTARVAVIGLGYVGVPVALNAAEAGFDVTGIDVQQSRVDELAAGVSALAGVTNDEVAAGTSSGRFRATTSFASLAESDVIVICVPTPLKDELPDMSHIEQAGHKVAEHLRPNQLVILESTTYPGTTEELLFGILESSGLKAGLEFLMGFSPERIDPGNPTYRLRNLPKIVGGIDEPSTEAMEAFYGSFIDKIVPVSSPKTAEMAKLLENTYRHVNIALVNEIAILCHDLGIDVWEVIDAAATKPFGFEPFYPGPGWGGHCIPVDPAYLSWRVRQMGATARFVDLAREFNQKMPAYVVQRMGEALNEHGKSLKSSRILVLGVTYKADVADLRESPAIEIVERARKSGAEVTFHDPFEKLIPLKQGSLDRIELDEQNVAAADLVLLHTAHASYDLPWLAEHARLILDTRNAFHGISGTVVKL